ncbi:MAG: CRISPR-associated endonuclease Cas2 [Candidatus Binatia bacterium]
MFYLVTYDIADNQRRTKVAKILEDFGDRVQYSVFEMIVERSEQIDDMCHRLTSVVDEKADSVRIYNLCQGCRTKIVIVGTGKVYADEDVYIIGA